MTDDNRDLLSAHSYAIRPCDCGSIHFDLKDENGKEFATLTMGPEDVDRVCAHLQRLKLDLTIGEVASVH